MQRIQNYLELAKPRLLLLVLATTAMSFYLASGWGAVELIKLLWLELGAFLLGAGANALNQLFEKHFDACMHRTLNRPLVTGVLSDQEAWFFGGAASIFGLGVLYFSLNKLSALIGFLIWASYLYIYTPLKRKTVFNTLAGAVPGALPVCLGWAAAREIGRAHV